MRVVKTDDQPLDGHMFILTFTFPSGQKYAGGEEKGEMTFIPIDETGMLKGVMAWSTKKQIHDWLQQFKKTNGEIKFRALFALKMVIRQIAIKQ